MGGRWLALALAAAAAAWFTAGCGPRGRIPAAGAVRRRGPVVKLGDVAEIFAADRRQADRLAAIELFPAPLAPQQRFLRVRELQDLLLLRGVNLAEHSFSGSSQVTVQGHVSPPRRPEAAPKALPPAAARKIKQRVCEAVTQYLKEHAAADQPWIVEAELGDAEARAGGRRRPERDDFRGQPALDRRPAIPRLRRVGRRDRCDFRWMPRSRCRRRWWWPPGRWRAGP